MTKYQRKELNKLLNQVIEARDKVCLKCGKTETLAAAHIWPKGQYRKIEYDTRNLVLLCYACHILCAHKNPRGFTTWLNETLDKKRLKEIDLLANTIIRAPLDYQLIKLRLEQELQNYDR